MAMQANNNCTKILSAKINEINVTKKREESIDVRNLNVNTMIY